MVTALILLLAQAGSVPTEAEIRGWIEDLSSPTTLERQNAARRLLESGDAAADALEAADLDEPEAILRARDLLAILRTPSVALRPPMFIPRTRSDITIEMLIHNPRPTTLTVMPIHSPSRRHSIRRTKEWGFDLSPGVIGPLVDKARIGRTWTVPPRADLAIPLRFRVKSDQASVFKIGVSYSSAEFEFSGQSVVRVGKESLASLRTRAYSRRPELREEAVVFVRHRLRIGRMSPALVLALKSVARSPYRDVRHGLAKALGDYGRLGNATQTDLLSLLAADRDLGVARVALAGLAKVCSPVSPPRATLRLGSRLLARVGDPRRPYFMRMLGAMQPTARRRFLAAVLNQSRSRTVHRAAASILRQDGYPVEPSAGGLVPRSQIERLAR